MSEAVRVLERMNQVCSVGDCERLGHSQCESCGKWLCKRDRIEVEFQTFACTGCAEEVKGEVA